ncbi:MAG TPA: hypothetical protein PKX17_02875, partial [Candidatus Methanomethylicus sp.]|nr:hypothetical protein [Candidatus Methanomethylicus sp.]
REIIRSLKSKRRLIFMSSHLLSEVSDVCDEVAMIDRGRLIIYDSIANVTAKVSGGESVVEVGVRGQVDDNLIKRVAANLAGARSVELSDGSTFRVRFEGGLAAQERILGDLARMNIGMISYRPASSALEEAYLSLVKDTA